MPTPIRTAIRLAMRARLATLPSLPPVAYEFQPFTPPTAALYLRESLLFGPSATRPITLGRTATKRVRAIYQLDVRAPMQTSNAAATVTRAADAMADALCDLFDAGLELVHDGRRVVVEASSSAQLVAMPPDWTAVPVSITCYADFLSFTS